MVVYIVIYHKYHTHNALMNFSYTREYPKNAELHNGANILLNMIISVANIDGILLV